MTNTTTTQNAAREAGQLTADRLNKLVALLAAGNTLLEYWDNSVPVHAGSDAAQDFRAAIVEARRVV